MAKKILKRSLALGALMAFVITGSAMANAPEKLFQPNLDVNGSNLTYSGIGHGGTVTSTDSITSGVISSYSNLTITAGTDIAVTVGTGTAIQTAIDSKSAHTLGIDFKGDLNITANGDAHGIVANANGSKIDIDGNGTGSVKIVAAENALSTSRRDTYNGTKIEKNEINIHDVKNVYIESAGVTEDKADRGHAIYAHNENSKIVIDAAEDVTVKAADGQYAVYANGKGAAIDVNAVEDLEITGDVLNVAGEINLSGASTKINGNVISNAYNGVTTIKSSNDTIINGDINAKKSTVAIESTGNTYINGSVIAGYEVGDGETVIDIGGKTISIDGQSSFGVTAWSAYYADNAKVVVNLGDANTEKISITNAQYGLMPYGNGAEVKINAAELNITNTDYGIWSANRSVSTGDNLDSGDRSDDAKIIIDSNTDVNMTGVGYGIVTMSQGTVDIAGNLKIEATEGAIVTRGEATTLINKANDANKVIEITGDIVFDYDDYKVDSDVVINLANEKSSLTGNIYNTGGGIIPDGEVTGMKLGLSNNAQWTTDEASFVNNLELNDGIINVVDGSEGAVTIDEVTGAGGTFKVDNDTANQIVIGKKGIDAETEKAPVLTVSTTNQELALNDLVGVLADETGTNIADVVEKTGGAVYEKESATVTDGELGEISKVVDAGNLSANDMAAVGLMSWRAEMNDMNKRMGELRNANGEHGVWVRMVRGESEYNSVKNQYNQYQLGYDEKLSVDKRWTVGAAISYTDAENNFAQGNGESTNKALSIYGSKLNADGTFVDLIAKYARLENEFDIVSGMGDAEYDANGYSFSAEFGKRIQQGNGLWIEPQVELTYGKVGSADYVTAKGVKVAQDSMESLVGRVGLSLGKDIKDGNVYARASYLYDFEGETQATLNSDAVLKQDLGGGWWEVGVGANINLSKATYIYADVEKTFGGEVDTNWQWNLGVRYSF